MARIYLVFDAQPTAAQLSAVTLTEAEAAALSTKPGQWYASCDAGVPIVYDEAFWHAAKRPEPPPVVEPPLLPPSGPLRYAVVDCHGYRTAGAKPPGAWDLVKTFDGPAEAGLYIMGTTGQADMCVVPVQGDGKPLWAFSAFPRPQGYKPPGVPAPPPPPPLPPTGKRLWHPPLLAVHMQQQVTQFVNTANKVWAFQPVAGSEAVWFKQGKRRLSMDPAPDGHPAICETCDGICWDNKFLTAPFGSRGLDAARLSVDLWLEKGFNWGTSDGKLGIGLWGGSKDKNSGGASAAEQQGFSIRVNRDKYGKCILYSYHLNRTSGDFGQGIGTRSAALAKGRWVNVQLELKLNTPGAKDGRALMRVDGRQVSSTGGLQYRRDTSWGIRGAMFSAMWGGNEEDRVNWSPKPQKLWYANFRLEEL